MVFYTFSSPTITYNQSLYKIVTPSLAFDLKLFEGSNHPEKLTVTMTLRFSALLGRNARDIMSLCRRGTTQSGPHLPASFLR